MYHNTKVSYKQMQFNNMSFICSSISYIHGKNNSSIIQPKGYREHECVNMQKSIQNYIKGLKQQTKGIIVFPTIVIYSLIDVYNF